MYVGSPGLNVRLDIPLGQGLLDAKLHRVFSDRRIACGNHNDVTVDVCPLVGERLDDLVVEIVPVLPRQPFDLGATGESTAKLPCFSS